MESSAGVVAVSPAEVDMQDADLLHEDLGMQRAEELRILMFGFATGMTVAAVFLVYVVLEIARAFP